MILAHVLIEHSVYKISSTFLYASNNNQVKKGVRVKVNFHNQDIVGFVLETEKTSLTVEEVSKDRGFEVKYITEVVDDEPIFTDEQMELAKTLASKYFSPLISILKAMTPPSLRPNSGSLRQAKISYQTYYKINEAIDASLFKLSKAQINLYEQFLQRKIIYKKDLSNKKASVEKLLEYHLINEITEEVFRYEAKKIFEYENNITLNEEQLSAFKSVINNKNLCSLLYGVTGSGKTEVYIKLVEYYIKKGRSALILVPEIGLTPLMISRALSYFDNDLIAIIHSSLTPAQYYDEYRKIQKGIAKIVIGTRSAIFAPLKDLGIICIDEENDESYYQYDNFSYNAIEVALIRASQNNAKVVLGSATPSIESMGKAKNGKYQLLRLTKRYNQLNLPTTTIVDNSKHENYSYESNIFSIFLIKKIREVIARNEQAILLINTKGYAKSIVCRKCGHKFKCPNCDIALFYHKEDNSLRCHHCSYKIKRFTNCPNCDSTYLMENGFGIERVEEDFKRIFKIPYLSLDGDRTTKALQISNILKEFDEQKVQVLIGTQLVTKGHDFKNVTLIGVINCDNSIFIPSYKSREMLFDLIYQVIGRSGRGDVKGEAIVQTYYPNEYAIQFASKQDYDSFFEKEIEQRKIFNYPPYCYLIKLEYRSKKTDILFDIVKNTKTYLSNEFKHAIVLDNLRLNYIGKTYSKSLLIKIKNLASIKETLQILKDQTKLNQNIDLKIFLNPSLID